METKTFNYKFLVNGNFISTEEGCTKFDTVPLHLAEEHNQYNLSERYNNLSIPNSIISILEEYCNSVDANDIQEKLINIICAIQNQFYTVLFVKKKRTSKMFKAVENEYVDLNKLFKLLKDFNFNNENSIKGLNFKTSNGTNISIQNLFVVKEIIKSISANFGLNNISEVEYDNKVQTILNTTNGFNFKKIYYKIRQDSCVLIYNLIKPYFSTERQAFQSVGALMLLAQFPLLENHYNIILGLKFQDYLEEVEPNLIRQIIIRNFDTNI